MLTNTHVHARHLRTVLRTQHRNGHSGQRQTGTLSQRHTRDSGQRRRATLWSHCEPRAALSPRTARARPRGGPRLDLAVCPTKGVIRVYADQVPGSRWETGVLWGSPQSRAGLDDGGCSRASNLLRGVCARVRCACLGVCSPTVHGQLRTERVYKTSRSERILFVLRNRGLPPVTPLVPASENHFQGTHRPPRSRWRRFLKGDMLVIEGKSAEGVRLHLDSPTIRELVLRKTRRLCQPATGPGPREGDLTRHRLPGINRARPRPAVPLGGGTLNLRRGDPTLPVPRNDTDSTGGLPMAPRNAPQSQSVQLRLDTDGGWGG